MVHYFVIASLRAKSLNLEIQETVEVEQFG